MPNGRPITEILGRFKAFRAAFVMLLVTTTLILTAPASAQGRLDRYAPNPMAPVDQAQETRNLAKLGAMSCDELTPQNLPDPGSAVMYGILDIDWTPDLFGLLRERVLKCVATWPANKRSYVRAQLNNIEPSLLARASQKRAGRQATAAQKQELLSRLEAIRSQTPASKQVQLLQEFEGDLGRSRLAPAEKAQVSAVLMRDRLVAESKAQTEAEARAHVDQAKQADREAKVKQDSDAFAERVKGFSAPVQTLFKRNPGLEKVTRSDADALMSAIYSGVLSLRLCSRKFGGYGEELSEMERRQKTFEAFLREVHGREEASLKEERDLLGVETGAGRATDVISANPAQLEQACNAQLGYISTLLDFSRQQ